MSTTTDEMAKTAEAPLPAPAPGPAPLASKDSAPEPTESAVDVVIDEPEAPTSTESASLAGTYRVTHGSFTIGPQQSVGLGGLVELTDAEAKAALANKTVKRA